MAETSDYQEPSRHVIGISFGNSNSSISHVTEEGKAEVIANELGGKAFMNSF